MKEEVLIHLDAYALAVTTVTDKENIVELHLLDSRSIRREGIDMRTMESIGKSNP